MAKELKVVLPISFYEKKNYARYNSLAVIDADGSVLGKYRKSHIPDGPGYEEKFYFNPGDTGFKVWNTRYAKIGVGVCWDQWYPEAARVMTLMGAEILFYPTAIGSEPQDSAIDSKDHWQMCMLGHAAANLIPVVASNRIGREEDEESSINFTVPRSSPVPRATKLPRPDGAKRPCWSASSIWTNWRRGGSNGAFSATAVRSCID